MDPFTTSEFSRALLRELSSGCFLLMSDCGLLSSLQYLLFQPLSKPPGFLIPFAVPKSNNLEWVNYSELLHSLRPRKNMRGTRNAKGANRWKQGTEVVKPRRSNFICSYFCACSPKFSEQSADLLVTRLEGGLCQRGCPRLRQYSQK